MTARVHDTVAKPPATILAGGLARRLGGGDKALRQLGGRPLLDHVIARLAAQCGPLVLNANGDPTRFAAFDLPVVADGIADFAGPLAGVLAGLDFVARHHPEARWVLSAPADCPLLPHDLVARLGAATGAGQVRIALAASNGRLHPVVALWDVALREELCTALRDHGVRKVEDFVRRYPMTQVEWPTTPHDPFFNVNTLDDVAAAERLIASSSV